VFVWFYESQRHTVLSHIVQVVFNLASLNSCHFSRRLCFFVSGLLCDHNVSVVPIVITVQHHDGVQ